MSYSENSIQEFNQKNLVLFSEMRELNIQAKEIEKRSKFLKEKLLEKMQEYDIKSIDNEYVKVTVTKASTTKSVDLKAFQDKEPAAYAELLEDYPKITTRSESIRITVK